VLRIAAALMVSAARHTTSAGVSRLIVETPDPSNGADRVRIRPWTAEDLRAPSRPLTVAAGVAYAHAAQDGTLSVSRDDAWGEQDQGTRPLEAVAYHQDHPKRQGQNHPYDTNGPVHSAVRFQRGVRSSA
jgi:hypothetical protein